MKIRQLWIGCALVLTLLLPAFGQMVMSAYRGKVFDEQGKPVAGAVVRFVDKETGRKFETKTNAKGEYGVIGVTPGKYDGFVFVDGKELMNIRGIPLDLSKDNIVDFDLAKERARAEKGDSKGLTAEQKKALAEQEAKNSELKSDNEKRKTANGLLLQVDAAEKAGNLDQAAGLAKQVTELMPNSFIGWARLAALAAQTKQYDAAIKANQTAIELLQAEATTVKDPKDTEIMANLHNNLGSAYIQAHKFTEAAQEFNRAAKLNPAGAAMYHTNAALALQNGGKVEESIAEADLAIATDPNYADAYYWKGIAMLSKAKIDGNKMVAPPGTAEAFNKYLELQPTGRFAPGSKEMLAAMGAEVETGYKKGKKK